MQVESYLDLGIGIWKGLGEYLSEQAAAEALNMLALSVLHIITMLQWDARTCPGRVQGPGLSP